MNIAIVGYGKMGKAVETFCINRGHKISFRIGENNINEIKNISAHNTDIAIEFSTPHTGFQNCLTLIKNGVRTISGTTGWVENLKEVEDEARERNVGFLYASNFSIGVNLFFQVNKFLASLMNNYNDYKIMLEEWHHIHKLDSPSGTSITLIQDIINQIDRITNYKLSGTKESSITEDQIAAVAYREGEIPGTHSITYESEMDSLEIIHTAKKRESFALGAVLVAEWINGKNEVYTMKDFLDRNND